MILVLGSVLIQDAKTQEALALSLEHVHRSRREAGCISHAVHLDGETPNKLVFVEEWSDMAMLQQHFTVPESRAFVKALAAIAVEKPTLAMYDANRVGP